MATTGLKIYFAGVRATLPYGTVENYKKAEALADELTGYMGRARGTNGDTFYLEKREQLDSLMALQRKLGVKRE